MKWSMERFYRGRRNPLADQTSYHKTFILSNLQTSYPDCGLYLTNPYLSNLQTLKTPYKNVEKCAENLQINI